MKKLMLGMAATLACHVGNVEAAQWMSFDAVNEVIFPQKNGHV